MPTSDFNLAVSTYQKNHQISSENGMSEEVHSHINFIFSLSQSYPAEIVSDFFNHSNFALTEAYEELNTSYELTKFGFYKQGLTSLRSVFELGILSTYWSIIGNEDRTFKEWVKAREKTPFAKEIKKKLLSNTNIQKFNMVYAIEDFYTDVEGLHNYVHTRGIKHSKTGQKYKKDKDLFQNWFNYLQIVIKTITVLHLLRFPIASVNYDFLKKFGTYDKTPFCGGLFGDYQEYLIKLIGQDMFLLIKKIANEDNELNELLKWLNNFPDLSEDKKLEIIVKEQKEWIKQSSFNNWYSSPLSVGLDNLIIEQLRTWAIENNYLEKGEYHKIVSSFQK